MSQNKTIKSLTRLLFAQGGRCFFCKESLPATDASVEHLVARANGGVKADRSYETVLKDTSVSCQTKRLRLHAKC